MPLSSYGELFWAVVNLGGFFLLLFFAEYLHHRMQISAEYTRKLVHVFGGGWALLTPLLIPTLWILIALVAVTFFVLWHTRRNGLLPSIHGVSRPSVGSVIFLLPFAGCYLVARALGRPVYFYLPLLILIISDSLAFFVGRRWGGFHLRTGVSPKTAGGSMAFLLSSTTLSFIALAPGIENLGLSLCIGGSATLAEAASRRGWDNLFVPLTVLSVLLLRDLLR